MRDPLGDADAVALKRRDFIRVVGHQPHRAETQLAQHFRSREVHTLVGVEAELLIRVERVEPGILQLIGPELVDEADAPALLRQIEQHAVARSRDRGDRAAQLVTAIAAQAGEQIAGKTLRMQSHQDR